jgi:hypothetical protein
MQLGGWYWSSPWTLLLGGIGVSREFSLDPYFVHAALPRTSGLATTPSTVGRISALRAFATEPRLFSAGTGWG